MKSFAKSCILSIFMINALPALATTWATIIKEPVPGEAQYSIHNDGDIVVISEQDSGPVHVVEATSYSHNKNKWSLPKSLSSLELDASKYRLASDPNGNAVAAWKISDGKFNQIQASIYSKANDKWSSTRDLSPMLPGLSITHLAMDESANIFIRWKQDCDNYDLISTTTYSAGTGTWSMISYKVIYHDTSDKVGFYRDPKSNSVVVRDKTTGEAFHMPEEQTENFLKHYMQAGS